jgi:AraC-like DNA-binding protein
MFRGLDAGAPWSLRFPPSEGINCYALLSGECWLVVEGVPDAVRVTAGDCVLLPKGRSFRLASDTDLPPIDAVAFISSALEGGVATLNGGGDCFGMGGYIRFDGLNAEILLGMLPPIVHLKRESDKAALRWCLDRLMLELREPQPGGMLIAEHLSHLLLVQALRAHLTETAIVEVGWLFALADEPIGDAIQAMHDDPARRWTLQALAEQAGMSRSSFALRFKQKVGASPLDYLTRWRMMLAADRLANSRIPVALIALALGYESENAFSTAFKRVMGCSPRRYTGVSPPVPRFAG